ncbi:MAG TPA: PIN domain-containing protein [Bacteroidota bacterium]|nr:PIN domain-containing protein [Bacteroidota bacterium]
MSVQKVVLDTDVLLEHLLHREGTSYLRKAMNVFFCYTTVFNAIEAFSVARSKKEIQAVDDAMSALKVLGLNSKSAKAAGRFFSVVGSGKLNEMPALIAGLCIESKLPIVTLNPRRFAGVKQLRVVPALMLDRNSGKLDVNVK